MLKLPELVLFEDCGGDWQEYEEALYSYFRKDFIDNRPKEFMGLRVGLKKHPTFKNKEITFWHFITEGKIEDSRFPDIRRCERIRWPKPIIENSKDENVKVWENERGGNKNICLSFGDWEYLVVLRKYDDYILPWTAYCPSGDHTRLKWKKEYNNYCKKANTAF
jgi:hypothetical protein